MDTAVGCVALRPVSVSSSDPRTQPRYQGTVISETRSKGYQKIHKSCLTTTNDEIAAADFGSLVLKGLIIFSFHVLSVQNNDGLFIDRLSRG